MSKPRTPPVGLDAGDSRYPQLAGLGTTWPAAFRRLAQWALPDEPEHEIDCPMCRGRGYVDRWGSARAHGYAFATWLKIAAVGPTLEDFGIHASLGEADVGALLRCHRSPGPEPSFGGASVRAKSLDGEMALLIAWKAGGLVRAEAVGSTHEY
jgi:hypothetical protein